VRETADPTPTSRPTPIVPSAGKATRPKQGPDSAGGFEPQPQT